MNKLSIILFLILSFSASAQVPLPRVVKLFSKPVFVDFKQAHYNININLKDQTVTTESRIIFEQFERGNVIFDLKKNCMDARIDGVDVKVKNLLIPGPPTLAKRLKAKTEPGIHILEIESKLKRGVDFQDGVEIGMWIRDLIGRKFLEQYLPTNFEYDQYKATMNINFIGGGAEDYEVMVNGKKDETEIGYHVDFPAFYTSSLFFVHVFKKGTYVMDRSEYVRLDGKTIPLIIYSREAELTAKLKEQALISLESTENFYGRFPHDFMIIFGDQESGGMEHGGATQTALGSLDHEIHHSFIGKSVIPENGNAGWMDEAIVMWRQRGFPLHEKPNFKRHNLACHSRYRRATDWDSYDQGMSFIAHLAYLFDQKGIDFKTVLRNYYNEYEYKVVNTQIFRNYLEGIYGETLKPQFRQYVCNPFFFKRWRRGTNPY